MSDTTTTNPTLDPARMAAILRRLEPVMLAFEAACAEVVTIEEAASTECPHDSMTEPDAYDAWRESVGVEPLWDAIHAVGEMGGKVSGCGGCGVGDPAAISARMTARAEMLER